MTFGKRHKVVRKRIAGKSVVIDLRVAGEQELKRIEAKPLQLNDVLKYVCEVFGERPDLVPMKKLCLTLDERFDSCAGWCYTELCRFDIAILGMGVKSLLVDVPNWKGYLIHELTHHKDYVAMMLGELVRCRELLDSELGGGLNPRKMKVTERYKNNFYLRFLIILDNLARMRGEGLADLSRCVSNGSIEVNPDSCYKAYYKLEKSFILDGNTPYEGGLAAMAVLLLYLAKKWKKEDILKIRISGRKKGQGGKSEKYEKTMGIADFVHWYETHDYYGKTYEEYGHHKLEIIVSPELRKFCIREVVEKVADMGLFELLKLMDGAFDGFGIEENPLSFRLYERCKDEIWEGYKKKCLEDCIENPLTEKELFNIEEWHRSMQKLKRLHRSMAGSAKK